MSSILRLSVCLLSAVYIFSALPTRSRAEPTPEEALEKYLKLEAEGKIDEVYEMLTQSDKNAVSKRVIKDFWNNKLIKILGTGEKYKILAVKKEWAIDVEIEMADQECAASMVLGKILINSRRDSSSKPIERLKEIIKGLPKEKIKKTYRIVNENGAYKVSEGFMTEKQKKKVITEDKLIEKIYAMRKAEKLLGSWKIAERIDPPTDEKEWMVSFTSQKNGLESVDGPRLVIGVKHGKLDVEIFWNDIVSFETEVSIVVQFGNDQPVVQHWITHDKKTTFYRGDPRDFIERLLKVDTLAVRVDTMYTGSRRAVFNVSGLDRHLPTIKTASNWNKSTNKVEIKWLEFPTYRVKVKYVNGQEAGRWTFPRK